MLQPQRKLHCYVLVREQLKCNLSPEVRLIIAIQVVFLRAAFLFNE